MSTEIAIALSTKSMSFPSSERCSSNRYAAKRHFSKTARKVSQLVLGSAIALAISSLSLVATAQLEPSVEGNAITEQPTTEADLATVEEKIARLDATVLTVENYSGEYATKRQIDMLLQIAEDYSALGAQPKAIELIDRAIQMAEGTSSENYPYSPLRIVRTYIHVGEAEAAESLLAKTIETSNYIRTSRFVDVAEAYMTTENTDLAASTLLLAIENLGEPSDWEDGRYFVSNIGQIAQAYEKLTDSVAAQTGLSRLVTLSDASAEAYDAGTEADVRGINSTLITALSRLAVAQSEHGNQGDAEMLIERAMERVRSVRVTGYIMADVARAYGHIGDKAVAEEALSELIQLAGLDIGSSDPVGPLSALGAIAIAYEQLGNTTQAEKAIEPLQEAFGNDLYMLGGLLDIRMRMNDVSAQEAVIQQMFDLLPLLRTAEFTGTSDVAMGYSGLSGLIEAYVYTPDDQIAKERLAMLEDFFKAVKVDPSGHSGQLGMLARAAAQRGDYEAVEHLLAEGTQALTIDSSRWGRSGLYRLAHGYSLLENEQVRQAGIDRLQQIADDSLDDADLKDEIRDVLTRARAGG